MNGGNSNGAAMALWQKFSDLQAQAEKHRSDRLTTEARCGRLRTEIEQVIQERKEDEKKTRLLEEGSEKFQNILDPENHHVEQFLFRECGASSSSIHEKLELAEKDYQAQSDRLNAAEQSWEQWKHWKQEQLISASDRSRNWRDEIQRLQLEAISVGLPHAYLNAAQFSSGLNNPNVGTTERDVQNVPDDGNDPISWIVQEDDLVLQQTVDSYKKQNEYYLAGRAVMTGLGENIRAQQTKCEKKKQRAASLRKQIQKIHNDCTDLESKIEKAKGTCSNTHRMVEISANPYLQGTAVRQGNELRAQRLGQVRPHKPYASNHTSNHQHHVQNPYAREAAPHSSLAHVPPNTTKHGVQNLATVQVAPSSETLANPRRAELTDICLGRRRLVGRDRQFGCSVGIGAQHAPGAQDDAGGDDGDDDDDVDEEALLSGTIGLTKRHKSC